MPNHLRPRDQRRVRDGRRRSSIGLRVTVAAIVVAGSVVALAITSNASGGVHDARSTVAPPPVAPLSEASPRPSPSAPASNIRTAGHASTSPARILMSPATTAHKSDPPGTPPATPKQTATETATPAPTPTPTPTPPPPLGGPTGEITGISGLCIDDLRSGKTNGTVVQVAKCTDDAAQNWTVENDGTVRVFGLCMIRAGGLDAGTPVELHTCNGGEAEQWTFTNGAIVNPASHRCLDVTGATDGVETHSTPLQIWDCTGGANQIWQIP